MNRILVVATRQIGDVLLTTPLIATAKARWPQATVDVLGFRGTLGMLSGNAQVNELIEVEPGSNWKQSLPLIRRLWRRYDLALVAQYSDRAHLYGWVAARQRSGQVLKPWLQNWWKRLLLQHAVVVDGVSTHAVLDKLALLSPWCDLSCDVVVSPPVAEPLPADIAAQIRPNYVVVQVPTLVNYKQWPIEHHRTLISALVGDGVQVVLSGGPSDADRAKTASLSTLAPPPALLDVAGHLSLGQLTTLLRGARLYIGPDTSITHQAAACNVPVLAIFGAVDPRLWGPWPQGHPSAQPWQRRAAHQRQRRVVVLQAGQPCVPCNRAGCENRVDSHADCLQAMSGEQVLAQSRAMLAEATPADPVR